MDAKHNQPLLPPRQRALKRAFDLIVGSLLLIGGIPLLVLCALAIRLDSPGPAFYRAMRLGEGRRLFRMIKLRTMIAEADRTEAQLILTHGQTLKFDKHAADPRVTRVGRFLRKWSLDELPQLLNVLHGEMSLVGPRPELPALEAHYSTVQRQRFEVPQGMTGWWQVNGRPQDIERKVELDLYYVHHYSLGLDLRILIRTIGTVVTRHGSI
ncbi:MAG TPA: sugar transferase [Anaerolineae bacterium]|nr:sugar transferase [Anaerolineae bacterium]